MANPRVMRDKWQEKKFSIVFYWCCYILFAVCCPTHQANDSHGKQETVSVNKARHCHTVSVTVFLVRVMHLAAPDYLSQFYGAGTK